ncbi:MAG: DUF481 domain-containing protein [Gammaproteobacteria bacterium]|nr:DUF481 domain-containing protein [Gammaproteobacteria bacterium]
MTSLKNTLSLLTYLTTCFLVTPLHAATDQAWSGEGELGITIIEGNSESENISAKLELNKQHNKWRHKISLEILKNAADGITEAEYYIAAGKSDYFFREKTYAFTAARYEKDRFSGFEHQLSLTAGYGTRFINNDVQTLDASAGLGVKRSKEQLTAITNDEMILRLGGHYRHKIGTHSEFTQNLLIEMGEDNTLSESVTGFKTSVTKRIATKISYTIKRNSNVPIGTKNTDKKTSVTIVFSF